MPISRRAFIATTLAWTALSLAGCGQAAAPSSPAASSAPSSASPKPSASAKPAASGSPAAAVASGKPAASAGAAASPAPSVKPAVPSTASAVKGAWVAITANMMPWPLAIEAGYFDKYGVNFNLQYVQGSVTSVQAMLAGDLDMASIAGSTVVAAQAVKQDIVMTAGYVDEVFWRIMANPGITSVDQLRGKNVAVTKVGNSDYFAWALLARKQGWKMEDFKFSNAGDSQGQVIQLKAGNADAVALSPPNDVLAQKAGAHMVIDEAEYHVPNQAVGMSMPRPYLTKNRPIAVNVAKATVEAIHRWKTDPTFAKSVIKKYLKQDDQAYIDDGYDAYNRLFEQTPYPSKPGFESVIEEVSTQTPAAKSVTPEQCMDTTIVKELEDSGFIKQIYGS
jgi:ABC-type nitrate/sulfonate/bicarbonate transport system substrate-binding protein